MSKAFVKEVEAKEEPIVEEVKTVEPVIIKTAIGVFTVKDKMYRLLVGDDNKWYKQEAVGETRYDPVNNSPRVTVWSKEDTLISKKEFESYFGKVKKTR